MDRGLIELNVIRRAAPHLAALDQAGLDLYAPEDFSEVAELVAQTGRATQTPMLSVSRNDFTLGTAFWVFLMQQGASVGGAAARLIDLRGESFENYLRRTSTEQYGRARDPIAAVAPPVSDELRGRLVYIGELQLARNHRGNIGVLTAYARMIVALAAMKWPDFDWMYAFIPKEHVKIAGLYGFTWYMPEAITWAEPVPQGRRNDHWMIALPKAHFAHVWRNHA